MLWRRVCCKTPDRKANGGGSHISIPQRDYNGGCLPQLANHAATRPEFMLNVKWGENGEEERMVFKYDRSSVLIGATPGLCKRLTEQMEPQVIVTPLRHAL